MSVSRETVIIVETGVSRGTSTFRRGWLFLPLVLCVLAFASACGRPPGPRGWAAPKPVQSKDLTQWRRDMDRMARQKNVVCKVSGIVAGAAEKWTADDLAPVINHTLDAFGPERVMFAGDWPVCTLRASFRQWVDALKSIVRQRPADQQRKLFHDNAVRFYGLK